MLKFNEKEYQSLPQYQPSSEQNQIKKAFLVIDGWYLQHKFNWRNQKMLSTTQGLNLFISYLEKLTQTHQKFNYIYYCTASTNLEKPLEGRQFKRSCQENQINLDIKPMKTMNYTCKKCKYKGQRPQQAMVDISIAVEIMAKVLKHGYRKLIFFAGDKDFKTMLEFLRHEVPELEICIVGFRESMAGDIKDQASRGKVFYIDDEYIDLFSDWNYKNENVQYEDIKDQIFILEMQQQIPELSQKLIYKTLENKRYDYKETKRELLQINNSSKNSKEIPENGDMTTDEKQDWSKTAQFIKNNNLNKEELWNLLNSLKTQQQQQQLEAQSNQIPPQQQPQQQNQQDLKKEGVKKQFALLLQNNDQEQQKSINPFKKVQKQPTEQSNMNTLPDFQMGNANKPSLSHNEQQQQQSQEQLAQNIIPANYPTQQPQQPQQPQQEQDQQQINVNKQLQQPQLQTQFANLQIGTPQNNRPFNLLNLSQHQEQQQQSHQFQGFPIQNKQQSRQSQCKQYRKQQQFNKTVELIYNRFSGQVTKETIQQLLTENNGNGNEVVSILENQQPDVF